MKIKYNFVKNEQKTKSNFVDIFNINSNSVNSLEIKSNFMKIWNPKILSRFRKPFYIWLQFEK